MGTGKGRKSSRHLRLWPKRGGPFAEITFHSPEPGKHLGTGACCLCSIWGSTTGFTKYLIQMCSPTGFCPHSPKVTHKGHSDSLCPSDTER